MENKNFDDYEDLEIVLDGERKETVIYIESTEQPDLKDLTIVEEN